MDRKGVGGFMEGMFAMMAVIVSLTAFLSILAYADTDVDDRDADVSFLEDLHVSRGKITGLDECSLLLLMEREGAEGIEIRVDALGGSVQGPMRYVCGERTDRPLWKDGTIVLDSDDGRRLLAHYEVVYWR